MPTAAILPIKRFDAAKQRLGDELGGGTRAALAAAMFADVLSALQRAQSLEAVVVVSGEQQAHDLATESGLILVQDLHDKGQSHAARSGLARAAALGCDRAIMISGDCPLLDAVALDQLIADNTEEVVVVPDRHGSGTNGLLINPSGAFEPQFGPDSLARHTSQAERRGMTCRVVEVETIALDVDTPDDLAELSRRLKNSHGIAQRTLGVLRQIERARPQRPVAA